MNRCFTIVFFTKFFFVFLLINSLVSNPLRADDGCLVSGMGMFYANPANGNSTTYFRGGAYYVSAAECSQGISPTKSYYSVTSTSNANCYAFYDGSGSVTSSSNYYYSGKKRVFNVLNCPIDDYIPLLITIISGLGIFYIKRKTPYLLA